MEPEARYTLIGALVAGLAIALVGALVWLSGAGTADNYQNYAIVFERQSLDGLQVGSDVNMRGVKVGRVENFGIDQDNINRVTVQVRVDRRTPVSTNTEAIINRNLVTGLARVDLNTPGQPGPPLREQTDDALPLIAEGRADLDEFTESAGSLIASLGQALDRVNDLLSDENRGLANEILVSMRNTTAELDTQMASIGEITRSLGETTDSIGQAFAGVGEEIKPLTREARRAMRDITASVRRMQDNLQVLASRAGSAAQIGVTELQATAREFRSGVESLSRALDRTQDARSALLGPSAGQLGPGEER